MRDIKFRHYDTRLKEMRYSSLHDGEFYINTKGVMYMYAIPNSDKFYKSYDVEQFVDLKDISGVEIYEGDVIRFNVRKDNSVANSQAYYNEKGVVQLTALGVWFGGWDYTYCTHVVIIGNIHSNPELLEQK